MQTSCSLDLIDYRNSKNNKLAFYCTPFLQNTHMSFELGTPSNFLPTLNKSRFLYGQFKMYTRTMECKTFKLNRSIFRPNMQIY